MKVWNNYSVYRIHMGLPAAGKRWYNRSPTGNWRLYDVTGRRTCWTDDDVINMAAASNEAGSDDAATMWGRSTCCRKTALALDQRTEGSSCLRPHRPPARRARCVLFPHTSCHSVAWSLCLFVCLSVCWSHRCMSLAKTAEPIEMAFWQYRLGCVLYGGVHGRHLASTIERSMLGGDVGCRCHDCTIC